MEKPWKNQRCQKRNWCQSMRREEVVQYDLDQSNMYSNTQTKGFFNKIFLMNWKENIFLSSFFVIAVLFYFLIVLILSDLEKAANIFVDLFSFIYQKVFFSSLLIKKCNIFFFK